RGPARSRCGAAGTRPRRYSTPRPRTPRSRAVRDGPGPLCSAREGLRSPRPTPLQSLSLQEISDRLLIQDLLVEEAAAIDERDWDRWEEVYVEDARIDWSANRGAARGNPGGGGAWAEPVLSTENFPYPQYQHYCTNFRIRVDGDRASSRHLQIIPIS